LPQKNLLFMWLVILQVIAVNESRSSLGSTQPFFKVDFRRSALNLDVSKLWFVLISQQLCCIWRRTYGFFLVRTKARKCLILAKISYHKLPIYFWNLLGYKLTSGLYYIGVLCYITGWVNFFKIKKIMFDDSTFKRETWIINLNTFNKDK
jgi:hypothetical protein